MNAHILSPRPPRNDWMCFTPPLRRQMTRKTDFPSAEPRLRIMQWLNERIRKLEEMSAADMSDDLDFARYISGVDPAGLAPEVLSETVSLTITAAGALRQSPPDTAAARNALAQALALYQ
jgi:hypothetical protein